MSPSLLLMLKVQWSIAFSLLFCIFISRLWSEHSQVGWGSFVFVRLGVSLSLCVCVCVCGIEYKRVCMQSVGLSIPLHLRLIVYSGYCLLLSWLPRPEYSDSDVAFATTWQCSKPCSAALLGHSGSNLAGELVTSLERPAANRESESFVIAFL